MAYDEKAYIELANPDNDQPTVTRTLFGTSSTTLIGMRPLLAQ